MFWLSTLFDLIFPHHCIGCGEEKTVLCDNCTYSIPYAPEFENNVFALFEYKNNIARKAVWQLKYRNTKKLGEIFGKLLYDRYAEMIYELSTGAKYLVIPIPISAKKRRGRGYNQSEIIAKNFAQNDSLSFSYIDNVLYKIKDTPSQVSVKDRNLRLKNIKDTFEIRNAEVIQNRNIILVDDVSTTGATIEEARKTLWKGGVKQIISLVVAH